MLAGVCQELLLTLRHATFKLLVVEGRVVHIKLALGSGCVGVIPISQTSATGLLPNEGAKISLVASGLLVSQVLQFPSQICVHFLLVTCLELGCTSFEGRDLVVELFPVDLVLDFENLVLRVCPVLKMQALAGSEDKLLEVRCRARFLFMSCRNIYLNDVVLLDIQLGQVNFE